MGMGEQRGTCQSAYMDPSEEAKLKLAVEIEDATDNAAAPFESKFAPSDMRQLALVAHNHMKPAMKEFIETYSEVLQKFRITGTQTTMRMCKSLWGEDDPKIEYGLTCTSGPLGGDAQVAALMCMEDLGGLIFFVDPLSAHPHQADIDSLIRLCNCGNVIVCPNPTSAMALIHTLRIALETGNRGMLPSFFTTLESPAVEEYKNQQELALAAAVAAGGKKQPEKPALPSDPSTVAREEYKNQQELAMSAAADLLRDQFDKDCIGMVARGAGKMDSTLYDDEMVDDFDLDEIDDSVDKLRRMSLTGSISDPLHDASRGSRLTGFKVPQQGKKKRGVLKTVMKSMRRMSRVGYAQNCDEI